MVVYPILIRFCGFSDFISISGTFLIRFVLHHAVNPARCTAYSSRVSFVRSAAGRLEVVLLLLRRGPQEDGTV